MAILCVLAKLLELDYTAAAHSMLLYYNACCLTHMQVVLALLQLVKLSAQDHQDAANGSGTIPHTVRAKLAMLAKQWPVAGMMWLSRFIYKCNVQI